MLTDARRRLFAAALLALVACLSATAHHASAHTLAAAATAADTAEVVEGTVLAVVIAQQGSRHSASLAGALELSDEAVRRSQHNVKPVGAYGQQLSIGSRVT